jgi:Methyltransferase small domain
MTKQEVLRNCRVEGLIVKLPEEQLDRKLYLEVAQSLQLIGGKWKGGKVFGFVFQQDPTELLAQIAEGEQRNLKKEYQFFETPAELSDKLIELAEIRDMDACLEPSAGQGAIVKAFHRRHPERFMDCIELMDLNRNILSKLKGVAILRTEKDFLTADENIKYDRIIANPPFAKNQDIDHIYKMWKCLKEGGRIVTIASRHWQLSKNKKETAFKDWLKSVNAEIEEIPAGTFKESGTTISSLILIIEKPKP